MAKIALCYRDLLFEGKTIKKMYTSQKVIADAKVYGRHL